MIFIKKLLKFVVFSGGGESPPLNGCLEYKQ